MNGARTIEELQEKLDGVYDLEKVEDCRKVIGVLLRSIRDKDNTAQSSQDQLKMLAIMILNGNPESREKAREVLAGTGKTKKEVMAFLMSMAGTMKEAEVMPNKQLIAEVTDAIWAGYDMASRESSILGEMIFRYKKAVGLPVSPDSEDHSVMDDQE